MLRLSTFSLENKEVDYASDLKDFLPSKKHLLTHYNELPTELYQYQFVNIPIRLEDFNFKERTSLK